MGSIVGIECSPMPTLPQALTIAASDSGGGAGIQADIKSIHANGAYALSVLVVITAQNTETVTMVHPLSCDLIEAQIDAVCKDFEIGAIKTGMLYSTEIVRTVSNKLRTERVKNLVVDPVMISKSGTVLLKPDAIDNLKSELIPMATLLTPNIHEAEQLSSMTIHSMEDVKEAARRIQEMGCRSVLITGGHLKSSPATDLLYDGKEATVIPGQWVDTTDSHGTGCTYSAAIVAHLAKGESIQESVFAAKRYITGALKNSLSMGCGWGPLNHFYDRGQTGR